MRKIIALIGVALFIAGCEQEPPPAAYKPREAPKFTPPATATAPAATQAAIPPGHPPLPPDHPLMTPELSTVALHMEAPAGWTKKPARPMTNEIYAAPKVEGDAEDADIAVSTIDRVVPLQFNIERWCTQFVLPQGQSCEQAASQKPLEGTKYPTTLVEISGAYQGGGMFTGPGTPKAGYRMLAAQVLTPGKPYFVKMVGPEKTVERWREAFVQMVRNAK